MIEDVVEPKHHMALVGKAHAIHGELAICVTSTLVVVGIRTIFAQFRIVGTKVNLSDTHSVCGDFQVLNKYVRCNDISRCNSNNGEKTEKGHHAGIVTMASCHDLPPVYPIDMCG